MEVTRRPPLVLLPSCSRSLGEHRYQVVREPYLEALRSFGLCPLVVPGASAAQWETLIELADGLLLTGSPSNVEPAYYGAVARDPLLPQDPLRDAGLQPVLAGVLARGLPLLGICRGLQELNVALGGSLQQALHEQAGQRDHRAPADGAPAQIFADAHSVRIEPGGLLEELLGRGERMVNSVHGQGVERLADGLRVEARAPDGVVEAFSMPAAPAFNLCVQWHPEWQAERNPVSRSLLQAFAMACRRHQRDRDTSPVARTAFNP